MGIREISDKVLAKLEAGQSRSEIYNELSTSAPSETGKIAYCIASVPKNNLRKKYIKHNAALCILLVVYSFLTFFSQLPIEPEESTIFLLISTATPFIFSYFVFKFHGGIYRLAGIWFVIDLVETVLLTGAPNSAAAVKLLVLFLIVVLVFFIARKVFPHLGILGPKKDASGHYNL